MRRRAKPDARGKGERHGGSVASFDEMLALIRDAQHDTTQKKYLQARDLAALKEYAARGCPKRTPAKPAGIALFCRLLCCVRRLHKSAVCCPQPGFAHSAISPRRLFSGKGAFPPQNRQRAFLNRSPSEWFFHALMIPRWNRLARPCAAGHGGTIRRLHVPAAFCPQPSFAHSDISPRWLFSGKGAFPVHKRRKAFLNRSPSEWFSSP